LYLAVELTSALVEILAVAALAGGLLLGLAGPGLAALFVVAGPGYGAFLTVISVIAEELGYRRYRSWRDFVLLVCAAVAESAGFRQVHAWWRLRGLAGAVLRRGASRTGGPDARARSGPAFGVPAGDRQVRVP
jgi:hypothetical protein